MLSTNKNSTKYNFIKNNEKKAFNDVKMIENSLVTRKDALKKSDVGKELTLNEQNDLKSIIQNNYTWEDLQKYQVVNSYEETLTGFKKYSSEELLKTELFGGYYNEQFEEFYSNETYYINLNNGMVILENGREVEGYNEKVFVKPDVIEEVSEKENDSYTEYPKFLVTKINNLNYTVKIYFHEEMEVKEYLVWE